LHPQLYSTFIPKAISALRYLSLECKRHPDKVNQEFEDLQYIMFFEFFRMEDSTEIANEDIKDTFKKNKKIPDKLSHDRCKNFHKVHGDKVTFDFEYVIGETVMEITNNIDVPQLSSHFFLNILLISKLAFLRQNFNLIINFYKDYKSFDSTKTSLRFLVNTYKKLLNDEKKQLNIFPSQFIDHNYLISKDTADKYTEKLLEIVTENLEILQEPHEEGIRKDNLELFIDDLEPFKLVRVVTPGEIKAFMPLSLSEDFIQKSLEEIIGENFSQNDWGGEINDMFSSHFKFNKSRVNVAFMLKGKGLKGELKIKNCGKNGDQIQRLVKSNATIYFIQHIGKISEDVRNEIHEKILLKRHNGEIKFYCIVDGTDTARILKAYKFI
jgi:hypothetical protein